jgi:hypothetical protein
MSPLQLSQAGHSLFGGLQLCRKGFVLLLERFGSLKDRQARHLL